MERRSKKTRQIEVDVRHIVCDITGAPIADVEGKNGEGVSYVVGLELGPTLIGEREDGTVFTERTRGTIAITAKKFVEVFGASAFERLYPLWEFDARSGVLSKRVRPASE